MSDNLRLQGAPLDPRDVIVPVLGIDARGQVQRFLGTGSIIGDGSVLLTADHVIRDWAGPFAIVTMHDLSKLWRADVIESDSQHDLALLRIQQYRPTRALSPLFDSPFHPNYQLITMEYGTTVVAGGQITLAPATRMGNMTRMLNLKNQLGLAGDNALELSWPALRGASGAPVLYNDGSYRILGVIVANASYHLLPAQIESVLDDKNDLFEEVRYMLPQAVAVNIRHLRPMYERL